MKKWLPIWLIVLLSVSRAGGQNPVLDKYISEGIESNLALKQLQLDYSVSLAALKEAKGLFFPDISINARYTVADGGRVITFPVGDLLNDVYRTLNQLTASEQFPQVENQEFNFYRAREHETKVSLIQPIFNSDLIHNVQIRKDYVALNEVNVKQYKRELIREIKTAYYNYQKTHEMVLLADSSSLLVEENLRVNRSLFNNDLVTPDAIYRSEAEVARVDAERARAVGMMKRAEAYFNFLLNRSLEREIELYSEPVTGILFSPGDIQESAVQNREEMEKVRKYISMNETKVRLEKGTVTPDLFGTVDYGFQGEEYTFTQDDDFLLASLVLRWQLFHGFTTRNKVQQGRIEGEKLEKALLETEQKIRMQVLSAYYAVQAAFQAINAQEKQLIAAEKAFRMIDRRYRENQATLLEFIDARTNFTNAKSSLIIARNEYYIMLTDLEYAAARMDSEQY